MICKRCGTDQPEGSFPTSRSRDGETVYRHSTCRDCRNADKRAKRAARAREIRRRDTIVLHGRRMHKKCRNGHERNESNTSLVSEGHVHCLVCARERAQEHRERAKGNHNHKRTCRRCGKQRSLKLFGKYNYICEHCMTDECSNPDSIFYQKVVRVDVLGWGCRVD